jgi:cell division protein FtsN
MAGMGKKIEPVDVGGSTLYRTTITGFATRAAAVSLCEKLKAAGKTCFVK